MKEIILEEDEIFAINSFLEEVNNIGIVEAVYIEAYEDKEKGPTIDVVAIPNFSLYYNEKFNTKGKRTIKRNEDRDQLNQSIQIYSSLSDRLNFMDENNLSLLMMHTREVLAEKKLVSGTIIYDRFGDMKHHQERTSEQIEPYKNILSITNIDKVSGNVQIGVVIEKK